MSTSLSLYLITKHSTVTHGGMDLHRYAFLRIWRRVVSFVTRSLCLRERSPIDIIYHVGRDLKPTWILWRKEKSVSLLGMKSNCWGLPTCRLDTRPSELYRFVLNTIIQGHVTYIIH